MDECKSDISDRDVNANCTNTEVSYKCKCKAGYTGDGHSCSGTYLIPSSSKMTWFILLPVAVLAFFFCQSSQNNDYYKREM